MKSEDHIQAQLRYSQSYPLAIPLSKRTLNVVISHHSCAGMATKLTEKRDANAGLF